MPRAAATKTDPAAAKAAQVKRDMAAVTHTDAVLRIPGTPYVVLSYDGPVDPQRLAEATDLLARRDKLPVILGGDGLTTAELNDDYTRDTAEKIQEKRAQYAEVFAGMLTTVEAFTAEETAETPSEDAETEPAPEPAEIILAHLRKNGPGSPRDIADATGLPKLTTTVELVRLTNQGAVSKNGLAYAAVSAASTEA
jgi:hypothetical protein